MENGSSLSDGGNDVMVADAANDAAAGGDFQPRYTDVMKVRFLSNLRMIYFLCVHLYSSNYRQHNIRVFL